MKKRAILFIFISASIFLFTFLASVSATDSSPRILSAWPGYGNAVPFNSPVTITFSEPVDTSSLIFTDSNIGQTSYTQSWNTDGTQVVLNHDTTWIVGTVTFHVIEVMDMQGNQLSGSDIPNSWTFNVYDDDPGGGTNGPQQPQGSFVIDDGAQTTGSRSTILTLYYSSVNEVLISESSGFSGAEWQTAFQTIPFVLSEGAGVKTIFMSFRGPAGVSSIVTDTIEYVPPEESQPIIVDDNQLIRQDPVPAASLPSEVLVGQLVKRPDNNAVYFIDNDNRRHAFPNDVVYFSWFENFDTVQTISPELLAQIPLGNNVTMRPGTWLIKIQSDPRIYAVEPYGIIRWIETQEVAKTLYGPDWNKKIVDVDVTFFVNYQMGSSIGTAVHPESSLIQYENDNLIYFIENGQKRLVTSGIFNTNLFQDRFVNKGIASTISYSTGSTLPEFKIDNMMTIR